MRTWGLIFSTVPGHLAVGLSLLVLGTLLLHFAQYCMETAPLHGCTILVLKLRLSFSEQSRFLKTPNCSVLAWGLCVCAYVYGVGDVFLPSAGAPFKDSNIKT